MNLPTIVYIYVSCGPGEPMQSVQSIQVIAGQGLEGDRYSQGEGSWNSGDKGKRQVTFFNPDLFAGTGFEPIDSRRNFAVRWIETPTLINKIFKLGSARFKGLKYCTVCDRPDELSGKKGFREKFSERGGVIAEVTRTGVVSIGDQVILVT